MKRGEPASPGVRRENPVAFSFAKGRIQSPGLKVTATQGIVHFHFVKTEKCYFLVQNLLDMGSVLSPGKKRKQPSLSTC